MNIRRLLLTYFTFIAFITMICTAGFFIWTVEADWSKALWSQKIFNIPLIVFVVGMILLISAVIALVLAQNFIQHLSKLNNVLLQFENGIYHQEIPHQVKPVEMDVLWERMKHLQEHLSEQAKISQRMATERAHLHEEMKEELLLQERNRLARELHDSVSQQLFAASMLLSAIREQQKENKQIQLVEQMIQQAQLEMRALLLHLRPIQLKGKSIKAGVEELLSDLSSKVPLNILWRVDEVSLGKGIEDHLFRIIQESVSNTLRHAKATTLEVRLISYGDFILLKIIDDGVGFQLSKEKIGGYGIQNIQERAIEIGATAKVISIPKKGTNIEVKVPII
ncbi:NarL family two-component system sensor histidine kinase LiaS [Oikeobacillus pervagus]|uniref:Sensor histidine kinase n=1 Tax=Oikeobacillus pervagus TaxID=1325931 RepID=A0AAJ1SX09_9BACI|nr:sensor histidine kinase [Oikeobacillus pervagus]MDQ0214343.1 NarL family two-component system sensor histidine kinase LiaS [Oikeobacillus pervagus]